MNIEDQDYIDEWVERYINMGYGTKDDIYNILEEILLDDGELAAHISEEDHLDDAAAEEEVKSWIHQILDRKWAARLVEQQTWDTTLHTKLTDAFQNLQQNNGFVYAMNTGQDVPGLRALLIATAKANKPNATAYVGFHDQALENAVEADEAPYLIYGPIQQPTKRFLESEKKYRARQDALYAHIAHTISDALTRHNIKHILNGEMLYIDEPWTKKLDSTPQP